MNEMISKSRGRCKLEKSSFNNTEEDDLYWIEHRERYRKSNTIRASSFKVWDAETIGVTGSMLRVEAMVCTHHAYYSLWSVVYC